MAGPGNAKPSGRGEVVILTDSFPVLSETFVSAEAAALARAGWSVRVEAVARPDPEQLAPAPPGIQVDYIAEDLLGQRLLDLAALVLRGPLAVLGDLFARRRWRRDEPVLPLRALASAARRLRADPEARLHVHFAAGAALCALRVKRLTGRPFSLTAHAYDIFQRPSNLAEKMGEAAFVTSGCRYNVDHLRDIVAPERRDLVHVVVMGVDGREFRRREPHPGGRVVLAVGRLIEKKGFGHLIDAAAQLANRAPLERLIVVGAGPLHAELRSRADRLGLGASVELAGPRSHDEVRRLLERADLLAMPCVIARDGDRDSMPVVVKEAMAMEVPVVASDEVGLPELVGPESGRLVPPSDARALAAAIDELLGLPVEARGRIGRAGRDRVLEQCDVDRETEKLSRLLENA